MNLHSGARTCPASRALLIERVRSRGWSVTRAAEAAGISRRTAHKWLSRLAAAGLASLQDHSSRPRRHPRARCCATSAGKPRRRSCVAWYRMLGIRVRRILTDNGSGYIARRFAQLTEQLRVIHKRTRPYRPRTNGKAERFIQTLLREWAYPVAYLTSEARARVLPRWLRHYNRTRPHGSLDGLPPFSRLRSRL